MKYPDVRRPCHRPNIKISKVLIHGLLSAYLLLSRATLESCYKTMLCQTYPSKFALRRTSVPPGYKVKIPIRRAFMKLKIMEQLKDFQKQYCSDCIYAKTEKVGTGQACCTYSGMPRIQNNTCFTRKIVSRRSKVLSCR